MFSNSDYLHERIALLNAGQLPDGLETDFVAWRNVLNVSGEHIFEGRLDSLGLTEKQARELTQRAGKSSSREFPHGLKTLREALGWPSEDPSLYDPSQPFSKIWAPVAGYAGERLTIHGSDLVTADALAETIRFLHSEIAKTAAEPTYQVFEEFRGRGKTFEEFVTCQRENLCEDIFSRFPVLARCLSKMLSDWISTTNLFLERLEADSDLLSAIFDIGDFRLRGITMGLSDRHAGGFQVIATRIGERKILYKPKEMSLESLLPTINDWLVREGSEVLFRFPVAVDRGGYGWAEWIDQKPCSSLEEVRRYYRQAGALLSLSHLLNAKDLLFENIVASGTDPVPIDLETFLQPETRTFDRIGKSLDGDHPAYNWKGSVIDLAFLPFWQFSSSHPVCDLSGLGCKNINLPPRQVIDWQNANTTSMSPGKRMDQTYRARNELIYQGRVQNPADFIEEIEAGFARFHRFIVEKKESFIDFISKWSGARSRLIFRPTQLYTLLIQQSLKPVNLGSGILRSIVLEQLYRPALKGGHLTSDLQDLFDFERDALLQLDVPRFYIPVQSDQLELGDGDSIAAFLWTAPLETVKRRIRHASESSLAYHLEVIRASLTRRPKIQTTALVDSELHSLLRGYIDQFYAKLNPDQNSCLWDLPSFVEIRPPEIERLSLYSGDLGTLIFLAAADRFLHRTTPAALLDRFRVKLEAFDFPSAPLGIGNGIGGLIYGSIILGELLEDESWNDLANHLCTHLDEARVSGEAEPEILYGVAGLLLALRKLYQVRPSDRTRRLGAICGENLCSRFRTDTAWRRPNGDSSPGFAHGSAGIAYALQAGRAAFLDVSSPDPGDQAFEFDRNYFDRTTHNWPSTTSDTRATLKAWCNGLPGVLLARTGVWSQTHSPELLKEIEEKLPFFPQILGLDHWCCGNAGAAEVLIYIGKILDRKDLIARARSMIDETVRRALKTVYYRFTPDIGENYCFYPSLFRGLAGVGYTLMHAMDPFGLPSIVAFE